MVEGLEMPGISTHSAGITMVGIREMGDMQEETGEGGTEGDAGCLSDEISKSRRTGGTPVHGSTGWVE
jgi:hypothetical protein